VILKMAGKVPEFFEESVSGKKGKRPGDAKSAGPLELFVGGSAIWRMSKKHGITTARI